MGKKITQNEYTNICIIRSLFGYLFRLIFSRFYLQLFFSDQCYLTDPVPKQTPYQNTLYTFSVYTVQTGQCGQ